MIRQGASWCDVVTAPWGVGFVYLAGTRVVCEEANTGHVRWRVDAGRPLLYLRAAADSTGRVCAIGQSHDDGRARAVTDEGHIFDLGTTHGVFPVLVRGLADAWEFFVQSGPASYTRTVVAFQSVITELETVAMAPTSQGFLYIANNGQPITQDHGRGAIPGLALPSPALPASTVWAGQSMTIASIALFDGDTGVITPINTPGGQPPHIVERDGTFYTCSYVNGGAGLWTHRRPFAAVTPPPVKPPPVVPPKEPDVSVRDVPDYSDHLRDIAARHPTAFRNAHGDYENQDRPGFLTTAQAEEFIRIAAWELFQIDQRIGLNGKRATSTLSQDALCFLHDDGKESVVDVINGAGGSNPTIGWSVVGHYRTAGDGQRWIQPQRVSSTPTNPGTPKPPTTPAPAPKPFPSFRVPEDVFLHAYTTYIGGLYARDQIDEPGGWKVASRGATMWFVPIFYDKIITLISKKGNQLPTPAEWWQLANEGAAAAIDFYRRTAPPE